MLMEKSLLHSKTFWGAIGTLIAAAAPAVGIALAQEDASKVADQAFAFYTAGAAVVSTLLTIYGRIKANKSIKTK